MPGDPHQSRLNAARCLTLARLSRKPEAQEGFAAMAVMWKQLAAETEADDALLRVFSEMEFGEPSKALPLALGLLPGTAGVVVVAMAAVLFEDHQKHTEKLAGELH
jgi:hypothetical protein